MEWRKSLALIWGAFIGFYYPSVGLTAELFIAHDLAGTGGGYDMKAADFSYFSLHQSIQVADINLDGFVDVVIVANGYLNQPNDYNGGGYIGTAHHLFGSGPGKESPNIRAGSHNPYGEVYKGSDLAWYQNDGFGNFYLHFITPVDAGLEKGALLYDERHVEAADVDGDSDIDLVVWAAYSSGVISDLTLGAGQVVWFENRLKQGEFFLDGGPKFLQHPVVTRSSGNFVVGGVTYIVSSPHKGTLLDMNGDGKLDLLVQDYGGNNALNTSSLYWFENVEAEILRFIPAIVHPIMIQGTGQPFNEGWGGSAVAGGDIDNDGDMDLVIGENGDGASSQRELIVLRNNGAGSFVKEVLISNFYVSNSLAIGDLVGNSCREIVAGGKDGGAGFPTIQSPLSVFTPNNSNCLGGWTRTVLPGAENTNHIWDIRIADINNDGRADVLTYYPNDSWTGSIIAPSGRPSMSPLWINTGENPALWTNIFLEENSDKPGAERVNGGGLAVADFDKDGDLDVVRSHVEADLALFENIWNTGRFFVINAAADRLGVKLRVTSLYSTSPVKKFGRFLGQRVQNK